MKSHTQEHLQLTLVKLVQLEAICQVSKELFCERFFSNCFRLLIIDKSYK